MTVTTNVKQMKLNVVTQQQYDSMTKSANELYAVTDANISYKELSDKPAVTSLPTAASTNEGDIYQYIGVTDQYYTHGYFYECVSDGAVTPTYSWEQLDVQPAGSSLPSQTGNAGKFLITDGTDASWGTSISNALTVLTTNNNTSLFVGNNRSRLSISPETNSNGPSVSFGIYKTTWSSTVKFVMDNDGNAYGDKTSSFYCSGSQSNIRNLVKSTEKWDTIFVKKINNGADITIPNTTGTMVVTDYTSATQGQVLTLDSNLNAVWTTPSSGGSSSTTVTLAVNDWSSNTQTVSATGVTASNNVIIAAAPSSQNDYINAGILCTAQGAGTLTFTCTTVPSSAITVNVLIFN